MVPGGGEVADESNDPVSTVVGQLAAGRTIDEVLADYPYLAPIPFS
jgi:uncharacterized protein (DUF433 family)